MKKNSKKPNQFKLTPEACKMINGLLKILPQFQRRNEKGDLMFRANTKLVQGKDLPQGTILNGGEKINKDKMYVQRFKEPILVNHSVNLYEIYQKDGQTGVDAYVNFFMDLHEKNKKSQVDIGLTKEEHDLNKENVLKLIKGDA
jgi:hypothetical protein